MPRNSQWKKWSLKFHDDESENELKAASYKENNMLSEIQFNQQMLLVDILFIALDTQQTYIVNQSCVISKF